jgi:PAS domain S-box-containing protein
MEEKYTHITGVDAPVENETNNELPTDLFKVASSISDEALAIAHNGVALFANERLYEIFRKSKQEILDKNLLAHVYPEDVAKAKEEIQKNRKIVYELRVVRGDGTVVYTEVKGHPIIYKGKTCRLLLIRDISRRKLSESRFRNYYNMMNAFPEAVFIQDTKGRILLSNERGNKMMGVKSGETIAGTNVLQYVLPEYHEALRSDKAKMEKMGAVTGRFIRIKRLGQNEIKSVEVSTVNIEWENGPAIMAICHDTSLEDQIEKSEMAKQVMQSINEHLQWEINEHKQLEGKLHKMVQEKEWLLKEVNHRVKNNLQIITSILNLQINQISDKKLIPVMREFQNRFYALSSIYSSLYHTETNEEIELSRYLKDLTDNLFISYSDPGRKIKMKCHTDSVLMEYDQAITCGLIVNELVSNSIKYAFAGKKTGKIEVRLKQTAKKIKLEVSDNGIGIRTQEKRSDYASLGLQLVDSLVTQLKKSKLEKKSGKNGTHYSITFSYDKSTKQPD